MGVPKPLGICLALCLALGLALASAAALGVSATRGDAGLAEPETQQDRAAAIIDRHRCACGCRAGLPGSRQRPACFGCSVGKAEITYIRESLAGGQTLGTVLLALGEPTLVEVFADYDSRGVAGSWARAQSAAREQSQHRVVLRTPVRTPAALRALKVAECARGSGVFSRVQQALIDHTGSWQSDTLLALAAAQGLDREAASACYETIELDAQIGKDRDHARERGLRELPVVTVNASVVADDADALREAIRAVLSEGSI